jgi:L-rhamnose isomerase
MRKQNNALTDPGWRTIKLLSSRTGSKTYKGVALPHHPPNRQTEFLLGKNAIESPLPQFIMAMRPTGIYKPDGSRCNTN